MTRHLHESRELSCRLESDFFRYSCFGESIPLMFMTSSRDKFTLLKQNSVTDVSVGFQPSCWCPSGWAPAWRLYTNLYTFLEKHFGPSRGRHACLPLVRLSFLRHYFQAPATQAKHFSGHLVYERLLRLDLGEGLCIFTSFRFPDSGLYLLNGFAFYFDGF